MDGLRCAALSHSPVYFRGFCRCERLPLSCHIVLYNITH